MKKVLELQKVSAEFIIEDAVKNFGYSESQWRKKADKYIDKYRAKAFYYAAPDKVFSYPRYYVEYITPDGLMLFKSFYLSGSLTNSGFARVFIHDLGNKGVVDMLNMVLGGTHEQRDGYVVVTTQNFYDATGKEGRIHKTPDVRRELAEKKILVSDEI